jgi:hypothetical protein
MDTTIHTEGPVLAIPIADLEVVGVNVQVVTFDKGEPTEYTENMGESGAFIFVTKRSKLYRLFESYFIGKTGDSQRG